jgi:hypothetical protein
LLKKKPGFSSNNSSFIKPSTKYTGKYSKNEGCIPGREVLRLSGNSNGNSMSREKEVTLSIISGNNNNKNGHNNDDLNGVMNQALSAEINTVLKSKKASTDIMTEGKKVIYYKP